MASHPIKTEQVECTGCKNAIDPDWCWCGIRTEHHTMGDGHAPVSMGCTCHYVTSEEESAANG